MPSSTLLMLSIIYVTTKKEENEILGEMFFIASDCK
jgi:hypothetical protein